jgi:glutamate dehydrogenase/leucine dehydrogenase
MTAAVQGFGNVGLFAARFLLEEGYRLVAVADSQGGCYVPEGIADLAPIKRAKAEQGTVRGALGRALTSEELLALPVDILVPAALGDVLTGGTAARVNAGIILELANGPTTREADRILKEKGALVIPDVLANAGGVAVSYFEWYQNMHGERWSKEEVFRRLRATMEGAVAQVLQAAERRGTDLRRAAYVVALERIQDGWRATGGV